MLPACNMAREFNMRSISKKILKQTRAGVLFLLLYSLISGCVVVPDTASPFPPDVYVDSVIPKSRVSGFVVNEAVSVSGLLEVEASFQNRRQDQYNFVYRFIWFDENNFTITTRLSNWKSLKVQAKGFATLRGIAPNERVARYRLEIYSQDTIFNTNPETGPSNSK